MRHGNGVPGHGSHADRGRRMAFVEAILVPGAVLNRLELSIRSYPCLKVA